MTAGAGGQREPVTTEAFAWAWSAQRGAGEIPPDVPIPTLLGVANRLMGGYWWRTAQEVGLSPPGLGVLRMLAARDGLKASEVALIGCWTPGTVTSLTDTLVRDGYVERRRDDRDRRVVRLYLTESGRAKAEEAMRETAPRWNAALDFISSEDEPVIRKFLVDTIRRFGELARERDATTPERKPGD